MTRRGTPLERYPLKGGVNTGIEDSAPFAEYEAAVAAGLDLWKWETGQYPVWFRANVLAWHYYHVLKPMHVADAVERARPKK